MPTPEHAHRCHFLVVEDVDDSREVFRTLLQVQGYRMDMASNGREAVLALGRQSYCAVLTDMWMPEMTGAELVAWLRSQPTLSRLPVILMSAAFEPPAGAAAADAFLKKPFDYLQLEQLLCRVSRCGAAGSSCVAPRITADLA